ncbi:uncharacterized protein [Magallana gigas]|uniref:uncharacterized protein isoform X2 n=1 Tax=Magallana gigas TaxID=29159 RepID=UPI00148A53C9|nr:mucin-5AC isoform X1 [Crassostrea gigas]
MIAQFDPLLLLLCHVILGGQLVCGDSCPKDKECCPKCADTEPSQTTATCSCSTPTSLQTTANSSRTTTGESPHSTTAIPSPSPNSSSLASSCPTVVTTDCPECSTISSSTTTPICPECPGKILQNSTPSPGSIIGATLGGAAFGSILTVIVFVCSRRRSHSADDSKEELTPNVVRNAAYQYNNGHINLASSTSVNSAYSEIHHNATRKAARISPVMRQEDTIWKEEVYNHLHESDKEDRSDYYDHAGPVPSLSVIEDGYGVLSMESKGNDNYNTVDRDYSTDCGKSMTAEHCK